MPTKGVSEATWVDLKSQNLVHASEAGLVLLTGHGWEAGLRLAGRDNAETREKVKRICHSIKSAVAGRSHPVASSPVRLGELASSTTLESSFIANVIEARLIESWLSRRGATWAPGFEGRMILVPLDFASEK
jgi:hypothetical protein